MNQIFDNGLQGKDNSLVKAKNVLAAFSNVTSIPVSYVDMSGNVLWSHMRSNKMCRIFPSDEACSPRCKTAFASACHTAFQLRESYLFICEAGLVNMVYPILQSQAPAGCFWAGPFTMGSNKESAVKLLSRKLNTDKAYQAALIAYLSNLKIRTPKEVQYIYELFQHTMVGALTPAGDHFFSYPGYLHLGSGTVSDNMTLDYPQELENQLMDAVKTANLDESIRVFEVFFKALCIFEHSNLVFIRVKLMELCCILSRLASRNLALSNNSFSYLECLEELNTTSSYARMHDLVKDLVMQFANSSSSHSYSGESEIVRKTLRYINEKYKESITLSSAAKEIHTNPSYLSTLFKKEVGAPFSGYLTDFRLQKCLPLLSDTNLNLTQICFMTGFNNQSYFSKVFKDHMKMTPGEYRRSHQGTVLFTSD